MKPFMPPRVTIVLADDHDLVRHGIRSLLTNIAGVEVIGEAGEGQELLTILQSIQPDMVVTDIDMPGMDGLAAIREIHTRYPDLRVLVLSAHEGVDYVKRAVANGACGYLRKDAAPYELELAVRSIVTSGSYFSQTVTQLLLQPDSQSVEEMLTGRQVEILTLLAEGKSSKEIGFQLGLSSKTIDVHRARIMTRLGLNDVASLTRYAVQKGLVSSDPRSKGKPFP